VLWKAVSLRLCVVLVVAVGSDVAALMLLPHEDIDCGVVVYGCRVVLFLCVVDKDNSLPTSRCCNSSNVPHTLTGSTHAAIVSAERNGLLLLTNVLEVLDGALKLHAVDGLCGFVGVLERDTILTYCKP